MSKKIRFEPGLFFDGDDLSRLMINDPATGAEGAYHHSHWSVTFAEGTAEELRQLASVHEGMHATLNDCTAWGSLLHAHAHLLRNGVQPDDMRAKLIGLIERTRTAHEAFATFSSLLVVGRGSESADLLAGYPVYREYRRLAQELLIGLTGTFFRSAAVNAIFRLCLQPRIVERVAESDLAFFTPDALDIRDWPDRRFDAARDIATPGFWKATMAELAERMGEDPLWSTLEAHRHGDFPYERTCSRDFDAIESALVHNIYAVMAVAFDRLGLASLPFDGHQPLTASLVAAAESLLPPGPVKYPLRAATAEALSQEAVNRETIVHFANERYVLRPEGLDARLLRPGEVQQEDWHHFVSGPDASPHLFLVARQASRVLPHYRLDDEEESWLKSLGDEPVVFLRRRYGGNAGVPLVEMAALGGPQDLSAVLKWASANGLPVYANLSLTTVAVARWRNIWLRPLRQLAGLTTLLDMSPFVYLDRWSVDDGLAVKYSFLRVESEDRHHLVFIADVVDGGLPILLAPCSDIVAKAIGFYLDHQAPCPQAFKHESGILSANKDTLGICFGHLLREESVFDFHGAQAISAADTWSGN